MAMLPHQLRKAVQEAEARSAAAGGPAAAARASAAPGGRGMVALPGAAAATGEGDAAVFGEEADRLRQLQRDRAQLELRKLQADAGLISKQAAVVAAAGLEWLYEDPERSREARERQREAYLLGKPIEAPRAASALVSRGEQIAAAGLQPEQPQQQKGGLFLSNDALLRTSDDTLRKLREDPLLLIRQAELAQQRSRESHPLWKQQQQQQQAAAASVEQKAAVNERKRKRKRKDEKKKKKRRKLRDARKVGRSPGGRKASPTRRRRRRNSSSSRDRRSRSSSSQSSTSSGSSGYSSNRSVTDSRSGSADTSHSRYRSRSSRELKRWNGLLVKREGGRGRGEGEGQREREADGEDDLGRRGVILKQEHQERGVFSREEVKRERCGSRAGENAAAAASGSPRRNGSSFISTDTRCDRERDVGRSGEARRGPRPPSAEGERNKRRDGRHGYTERGGDRRASSRHSERDGASGALYSDEREEEPTPSSVRSECEKRRQHQGRRTSMRRGESNSSSSDSRRQSSGNSSRTKCERSSRDARDGSNTTKFERRSRSGSGGRDSRSGSGLVDGRRRGDVGSAGGYKHASEERRPAAEGPPYDKPGEPHSRLQQQKEKPQRQQCAPHFDSAAAAWSSGTSAGACSAGTSSGTSQNRSGPAGPAARRGCEVSEHTGASAGAAAQPLAVKRERQRWRSRERRPASRSHPGNSRSGGESSSSEGSTSRNRRSSSRGRTSRTGSTQIRRQTDSPSRATRQLHFSGEDPEDDSRGPTVPGDKRNCVSTGEQQRAATAAAEKLTAAGKAAAAGSATARTSTGSSAPGKESGGSGDAGAERGGLLQRVKTEPLEHSDATSSAVAVGAHVRVKQEGGSSSSSSADSVVLAASASSSGDGCEGAPRGADSEQQTQRKRVYGPTLPPPRSQEAAAGTQHGKDADSSCVGVREDLLPPPAILQRAKKLQEQREAREQAAVAARNAAIDQAVREQRERQQRQQQAQEGGTGSSRNLMEEKIRLLKEEGERHEEEKARRRELLEAKEKLQEQLEEQWRVKHEGAGLLKAMHQQAFLAEGASVEDLIHRRRARRLKALGEEHELLATRTEQRF